MYVSLVASTQRFHVRQVRGARWLTYVAWVDGQDSAVVVDPVTESIDALRGLIAQEKLKPTLLWQTSPGRVPSSESAVDWLAGEWSLPVSPLSLPGSFTNASSFGPKTRVIESNTLNRKLLFLDGAQWLFAGDSIALGGLLPLPKHLEELDDSVTLLPLMEEQGRLFSSLGMERSYRRPEGEKGIKEERFGTMNASKYRYKLSEHDRTSQFIDVREKPEFVSGHIPGTINLPLSELAERFLELDRAQTLYLSCQSGRRSGFAAETLCHLGFRNVVNVSGGFQGWSQAGLPVEGPDGIKE